MRVLGVGGFGIVYLAFDHALEREVAVKEYMPASLAGRTETMHVSLRSQSDSDTFALGLRSFVNEAKLLARFDHPSLLKVLRFWESHGTAYMAMPVYRGRTCKEVRAGLNGPPDEASMRALLDPLLGALEKLHSEGVYHRDIAPDNIIVEADGRPVLLDFGAARRVISDKSQALTAILKPAYAPIEQYAEAGSVKQGPWTDLYALGATMHYMLLGRPPSPATARAIHDDQTPLSGQAIAGCSDTFLHVIDWMLAPRPIDRPQNVAAVRDVLEGRVAPPVRRAAPAAPQGDWERTQVIAPGAAAARTTAPAPGAGEQGTVIVPPPRSVAPPAPVPPPPARSRPATPSQAPAAAPAAAAPSRSLLLPALLGAVAIVAVAGFVLWPKPAATPTLAAAEPAASAAAVPTPAAPIPEPAIVAAPVAAPASAETPKPEQTVVADTRPAVETKSPTTKAPVKSPPKPAPAPVARASDANELAAHNAALAAAAEAARPTPPPAAPVTKAASEATVAMQTPKQRCGNRLLLALQRCMDRECAKPELRQHAECVKWRTEQERIVAPTQ